MKKRSAAIQKADATPEFEQAFNIGGVPMPKTFAFSANNTTFAKELKLENSYSDLERNFTQIDRAMVTKLHKQGAAGTMIAETFNQATAGIVDLLVVVDNSGSMAEEQNNLATKLEPLLSEIKDSDWQINVITTDVANPCSRGLIKRGQADALTAFRTAVTAGVSGSGNEQGVRRSVEGLGCQTPAWLRANSTIGVLIVSDEDNCSTGTGCGATPQDQPSALTDYITGTLKRMLGKDARIYGLIWVPGDATCTTAAFQGNQYQKLVMDSGGASGSICAADYTPTLKNISKNIATLLKSQFVLKDKPDNGAVTVKVNDVLKTTGFTVTNNVLTFTEIPPFGAKVDVSYVSGRQPQVKEFDLGEAPATGTLSVLVNMVEVKAGFTFDAAANKIVFDNAPEPSADIRITFRRNTALLKDFALTGANPVMGSVKVMVDNKATTDFTYDATAKIVRLNTAPLDLIGIKVAFKNLNGPVLSYSLPLSEVNPKNFSAQDKDSKAPVGITYKDGNVEVAAADHKEGRVVTVVYTADESFKSQIRLVPAPLPDSVVVDKAPDACSLGKGLSVENDTINLDCDLSDAADFAGSYQYELEMASKFPVIGLPWDPEQGEWTVYVNDEPRTDYTREGTVISFEGIELPKGGEVRVKFNPKGK